MLYERVQSPDVVNSAQAFLVKGRHFIRVDQDIPSPDTVFHVADTVNQGAVVFYKCRRSADIAFHQGLADEKRGGMFGIDVSVGDPAVGDDHQTKKRDLLGGHHFPPVSFPVRVKMRIPALPLAGRFQPIVVDPGTDAGEEPGRFHHFHRHDPPPGPVKQA